MKFQRILFLLGWLLAGGQALAADDDKYATVAADLKSYSDSARPQDNVAVRLEYRVPVAKWRTTPRWNPETEPVPLGAEGAVTAAKRWIAAQPWADQFAGFGQIGLTCWGDPAKPDEVTGRWFYSMDLLLKDLPKAKPSSQDEPTPQLDLRPKFVVLLFDGTVIEPTISKLVTGGKQK